MAVRLFGTASRVLLALAVVRASADCECGYSAKVGGTDRVAVFTDLTESDFTRVSDISEDADWIRQKFTMEKKAARGKYGESFEVDNIETFITDHDDDDSLADDGEDYGLQILVASEVQDGNVLVGEVDTSRNDLHYGSFRTSMKLTDMPGTCAAFFWYFNDTQEIDMEFLSREFNSDNKSFPVNLVLQSRQSADAGYDASKTGNFIRANLPFDPTSDFHEYRIDYLDDAVYFYADGEVLAEMKGSAVPTSAGHLILQHWSNGNPRWSGGPPEADAVLTVGYVKAYFNSSEPQRQSDWENRCSDAQSETAVCEIPDVVDDKAAASFFFSEQDNMTNNQTISWPSDGGMRVLGAQQGLTLVWTVFMLACACML